MAKGGLRRMHIKSIVSDEDREELERMLSLGFIIPNQLFKTRQKSRMTVSYTHLTLPTT